MEIAGTPSGLGAETRGQPLIGLGVDVRRERGPMNVVITWRVQVPLSGQLGGCVQRVICPSAFYSPKERGRKEMDGQEEEQQQEAS